MASLQFALLLVIGVVSRSLAADESQCSVQVDVTYSDGAAPSVACSDTCGASDNDLWFEGTAYQRVPRLTAEFGLMVKLNYQNGALTGCSTLPYQTVAEAAAEMQELEACMGIEDEATTTTAPLTTAAPTTDAPIADAPTTAAPTTAAPTTAAPTTDAPTTDAPTTAAPTTDAPTTAAPTTAAPTTAAPTTAVPTTAAPVPLCPAGFTQLLGNCYLLSATAITRAAALTFCNQNGASLAFIQSQAEQDAVQTILTTHTYIGINDIKLEGAYTSLNNVPAVYTNWNTGEPNGLTTENCVVMRQNQDYRWNDVACSKAFVALCKVAATF